MDQWAGVVLAAGLGVRMNSRVPKALHRVCGKELVRYPVELLGDLGIQRTVVVVSPGNSTAVERLLGDGVEYAVQPAVLGTGDATHWAAEALQGRAEHLLVLNSDTPLLRREIVQRLMDRHLAERNHMTLLTGLMSAPDLGRVLRDDVGRVVAVVETAEATAAEPAEEVNGGVYCFATSWLWENLARIEPSSGGERYLTSLAAIGA